MYRRRITHKKFKSFFILHKYYLLDKHINSFNLHLNSEEKSNYCKYLDDSFLVYSISRSGAIILMAVSGGLFFSSIYLCEKWEEEFGFYNYIPGLIFLFYVIYYFFMSKKEFILNRIDGVVTYPGLLLSKNITMPIEELVFSRTSIDSKGNGANMLQLERPNFISFPFLCNVSNSICYDELSFILWYMDKNRPLPPGDAFDEFRERDYERRKAEGFPKPLCKSSISTPEATPEQRKERKHIGGW